MSQFDRAILNYCKKHSDDADCVYVLKSYEESVMKRKTELERWKRIVAELEQYGRLIPKRDLDECFSRI